MNSLKLLILLLACAMIYSRKTVPREHKCGHDQHKFDLKFVDIPVENAPGRSGEARGQNSSPDGGNGDGNDGNDGNSKDKDNNERILQTTYPNMRIYANYDNLKIGTASFLTYIQNELVPSVVSMLQKLLKTKYPVIGNLQIPSYYSTVCGVTTPTALISGGVPADLALLITAFEDTMSSTIAYASPCVLQTSVNRPILGLVSFNTAQVQVPGGDPLTHEDNLMTTLHEITHVLGFSSSLFQYFVDANGYKRTGHILTRSIGGSTYSVINLLPLTTKIREHFGCSTLEGGIMENQGGSGSMGSHFERRFYGFEYMTSSIVPDMRISNLTLALLEGSGWYFPDYSFAEPMNWGKGQGCTFVTGSCTTSLGKPAFSEFCTSGSFGCSPTARVGVSCNPSDMFNNGCSWFVPLGQNDCEDPDAISSALLPTMEAYGGATGSRCFTGNLAQSYSFYGNYGYCFKYTCEGTGLSTVLKVQIGTTTVTCSVAGSISVPGLTGKLACPDPIKFCGTFGQSFCKRGCMGNGSCVSGKCQCVAGWGGLDCGQKV